MTTLVSQEGNRGPLSAGVPVGNCAHSAPRRNPSAEWAPRKERRDDRRGPRCAVLKGFQGETGRSSLRTVPRNDAGKLRDAPPSDLT